MYTGQDMILRISPGRAEITVEQTVDGVVSRKTITPEALGECLLGSRCSDTVYHSGILPENCVGVQLTQQTNAYFIRYPDLFADISYYGTVYENFPLPRLVFRFQWEKDSGKVTDARLCVVKDGKLTPETPTFHYPFSNVHGDHHICTGNNALPIYKNPARIFTLAGFILRMPNNNDMFRPENNKLKLAYRDLLEYLKDKDPSVYEAEILVPDGGTYQKFTNGR